MTVLNTLPALGDVIADFDEVVRLRPAHPAVVHNGAVTSYHELAQQVQRVARRYRSHTVGTVVSHDPAAAVHLLGALRAGATYCPIDAAVPPGRRRTLAAALKVAESSFLPADLDDAAMSATVDWADPRWQPGDPAYVLCTSGSTGMPKPVLVSRGALVTTVRELRQLFALTPADRVLQFASLGWDTCLEEILPALTAGATLVFDDRAFGASFPGFLRMLAERQITVIDLPTAFWHELVLHLHDEGIALPDCVRLVVIGGERVDPTRLRQWRDIDTGQVRLLNTYGCTETTMITHAAWLDGIDAPIGRALPHVREHIGPDGELWVGGPSLATGYLGLAEATATAFPTADHGAGVQRWFRTGDLVARGPDGLLHARGRIDEQVKVLGVRVHPAEVEMQLRTHPAVTGAVVIGERRLERTSLRAYVVATEAVTSAELKAYLRERLPSQFVPSSVKFVASLAYTTSGKVDRAATHKEESHEH